MSPKKRSSSAVAREGVNVVRSVVERANCLFHPIASDSDFGIDGIIELVRDERVRGVCVAVQIKSGRSYKTRVGYAIPATSEHFVYWRQHSLPVIGVVYDPDKRVAFWTNISHRLQHDTAFRDAHSSRINFEPDGVNAFDDDGFATFFLPMFLEESVVMPLERSISFARSSVPIQQFLGLRSLAHSHSDRMETWDALFELFEGSVLGDVHPLVAYALAQIPGHLDMAWSGRSPLGHEMREGLAARIRKWTRGHVRKLMLMVDENGVERGTVGQNVDALLSLVPDCNQHLRNLIFDNEVADRARQAALLLFAHKAEEEIGGVLEFASTVSCLAGLASELLRERGYVSLA